MALLALAAGLIGTTIVTGTVKKISNNKNKTKKEIEDQKQQAQLEIEEKRYQIEQQRYLTNLEIEKQRTKKELDIFHQQQETNYKMKMLDMNKNVLSSNALYSIKCVSCHAILTGNPYKKIRCLYCDTFQTITDDSKLI